MALTNSSAVVERIHDEDVRLLQRINAVAAELHRLWAADRPTDTEQPRRFGAAALQKEIDELYERRRQLVAERALLGKTPRYGRRQDWAASADLAA
jgi:hypothetical protein